MKNVGEKSPRAELEPIGPSADLTIRRQILASDDLFKKACSKPRIKVSFAPPSFGAIYELSGVTRIK